ncbi:MAG: peptide ABC transporter substrate-binding protein [Candidatus Kerfeldbacteria bacterium]|nr:peptide ABC transporter substrate-binding protein [Candidatus Kerfeldbacteria bacterium]
MFSWLRSQPDETIVFLARPKHAFPSRHQLTYVFSLWTLRQRVVALIAAVVFVVATPWTFGRWYTNATVVIPQHGGSYTEGMVGSPEYINPLLSPLSDVDSDLVRLLFSSLFQYSQNGELQPDLVTEYSISEDQLTYTFTVRQDAKWHDGEPVTVDDMLFTVESIQDPVFQSPLQSSLDGVTATRIDDTHFSLKLAQPYAPFLTTLTFGIIPQHLWYDVPGQNVRFTELNTHPIGSGPYAFSQLTRDSTGAIKSVEIKEYEDYYGAKPFIPKFTAVFFPESALAQEALRSKKVDGIAFVPADAVQEIRKKEGDVNITNLKIPQYTALFFNQVANKQLQDPAVRLALATAINRDDIIAQVFNGAAEPIFTPILPGYLGYNPEVDKHLTDIDASNKTLEDAGWKFPEGVTADQTIDDEHPYTPRAKNNVNLEFTVSTVDTPEYRKTLEIIQQACYRIGVKMNIAIFSAEDIQNQVIKPRHYEGLLFSEIVGTDPDPYPFWHSSQQKHPGLALAIFRDKEADALLQDARKTNNAEERRLAYLHFQNNLASSLPAIFLYNSLYSYAVDDSVQGIPEEQYITVPSDRFASIASWYMKSKRIWK